MVESVSIPDYAECLDNIKGETNKLVKMFNDLCREQGEQSYLIDLEEIRNDVKDMAKRQVSKIVNMAKA